MSNDVPAHLSPSTPMFKEKAEEASIKRGSDSLEEVDLSQVDNEKMDVPEEDMEGQKKLQTLKGVLKLGVEARGQWLFSRVTNFVC